MERAERIELSLTGWEPVVLPLNHARVLILILILTVPAIVVSHYPAYQHYPRILNFPKPQRLVSGYPNDQGGHKAHEVGAGSKPLQTPLNKLYAGVSHSRGSIHLSGNVQSPATKSAIRSSSVHAEVHRFVSNPRAFKVFTIVSAAPGFIEWTQ